MEALSNEADRLKALSRYEIIDSEAEESFDHIVRLAARHFCTKVSLITLLDTNRQWFKACWGLGIQETAREVAFCDYAIRSDEVLFVPDALLDPRFVDNPLVTGPPHIRFYAGAPLRTPEGYLLGTLCVIDDAPRTTLSADDRATLVDLAQLVMEKFELRYQLLVEKEGADQSALHTTLITEATAAATFGAAVKRTVATLRETYGALFCNLFRWDQEHQLAVLIEGTGRGAFGTEAHLAKLRAIPMQGGNSPVGRALSIGEQVIVADSAALDRDRFKASALNTEHGVVAQISTPFDLFGTKYAFSIGFDSKRQDLSKLAERMLRATAALRPMLRRFQDEGTAALFKRAVDCSVDAVLITEAEPIDEPGPRIVFVNQAMVQASGYPVSEMLGRTPRMFAGEGTSEEGRRNISQALRSWRPVRQELLNYRKSGEPFWVELHIAPVTDSTGWFTNWVSVQRDVTARHEGEARRRASAQHLARLISSMPATLMRHRKRADGKWIRTFIAESVERLTGYTVEEAFGFGWWVTNTSEMDLPLLYRRLSDALAGGQSSTEFLFTRKDKRRIWIRLIMRGHIDPVGEPEVIGLWSDVTHERETTAKLAQTTKLSQLGEVATGMAHELNQPLAVMSLAAENALRALPKLPETEARLAEKLDIIMEMTQRAILIVDHMRIFGRTENGSRVLFELPLLLNSLTLLVASRLRQSDVSLKVDMPVNLPPIFSQAVPLEQVLMNLVINACDAYDANGAAVDRDRRLVIISAVERTQDVLIVVRDHAGGVAPDIQRRVFEPFFTTKASGDSLGLGLSVSYGIITELGGTLTVGNWGDGAVFSIALPKGPGG